MYELKRVSLANWYLVDALDVPFDGHVAIIGQTGAGKSSILDAIQTAISGNNRNVLELNAAAGDQRDRSVRDYALGCVTDVNDGKPRRDRCETTIALTFHDRDMNRSIVIGVFLKAEKDQAETTRRFVIEDYDFRIDDFLVSEGTGQRVMTHQEIADTIKADAGDGALKFHPNSSRYVGAYLEAMRPSMPPDPKRFLRTFSNAVQAKEISDPTTFVRRFVLEPMQLDVEGVRSSINTWREMAEEVTRIENLLADIAVVDHNFEKGFNIRLQEADLDVLDAAFSRTEREVEIAALGAQRASKQTQVTELQQDLDTVSADIDEVSGEIEGVREAIRSQDRESQLALKDAEIRAQEANKQSLSREVASLIEPLQDAANLRRIHDRLSTTGQSAVDAASRLSKATSNKTAEEWVSNRGEVISDAHKIKGLGEDLHAIMEARAAAQERLLDTRRRVSELEHNVDNVDDAPILSRQVSSFLSILRQDGINARPLPELVDVNDPSWAFALESLLGPNREALLIEDQHLEEAFGLLFRNRNQFDTVRLINPRRLQNLRDRAPDSIADVVTSTVPEIEAFLTYTVGGYARAEDETDLDKHRNAILRNGKTNAGATKRVFRDRKPILGKAAQSATQKQSETELAEAHEDAERDTRLIDDLDHAIHACRRVATLAHDRLPKALEELSATMGALRSLKQAKQGLTDPDMSEAEARLGSLTARLDGLTQERDRLSGDLRKAEIAVGVMQEKEEQARADVSTYLDREADAERHRASPMLERLRGVLGSELPDGLPTRSDIQAIPDMEGEAATQALGDVRDRLKEARAALAQVGDASVFLKRANNGLLGFAQRWMIDDAPLSESHEDEDRFFWTRQRHTHYRDHELLHYKEELENARETMETSLKEGLIGKLGEHFSLMEQQLASLNRRLERYSFVGQTYQFKSSVGARFLPIYEMVKAYEDGRQEGEDISTGLEEVEALLNDETADLKKFEDYREYFNFELYIEHPDPEDPSVIRSTPFSSVLGKLSGGQRQAPYYVAIAASMVSSYYPKAAPGDYEGMGLMLFDEAFNRLDIPNTQRLMDLFRSLGLQVIVAAPEEKRGSLIECVESIISVSRVPGTSDVFIDMSSIGPKAKEAMLRENPEHQGVPAQ